MKGLLEKWKGLKDDKEENQTMKAIIFFGFYFIFFAILICLIVFGGDRHFLTQEYEKGQPSLNSSLGDSFSYSYHIQIDDVAYDYVGKQYDNVQRFQYQGKEYYFDGEKYYVLEEEWFPCDNPYLYNQFSDIQTFVSIIQQSTYVAKTEYENGDEVYHYLVSSNVLNDLLWQEKTEYENSSNTIDIVVDANRHITKISYGLDDYGIHKEICQNKFTIDLQYAEYGEVEKIENPIQ